MNLGAIITGALFRIGAALFTEKVLVNLIVVLADWAAKRTSNDLDDRLVEALKDALDKQQGKPNTNLYAQVKGDRPG